MHKYGQFLGKRKKWHWGGGPNISPADFKNIRSTGFDTVRIPVRWDDYSGDEPDFKIEPNFVKK